VTGVEVETGERFEADHVLANATPWNIRALLDPSEAPLPDVLERLDRPDTDLERAWGAFVLHCGIDADVVDPHAPLHHQVHLGGPVGEGNTAFISISPNWDASRAPTGKRAVTITTHTKLAPWWDLLARDPGAYAFHKANYQDRLLAAAELAVPGFRRAIDVVFSGTPITYAFYTGRARGWVGGIPQTKLVGNFAPELGPGLSMVGDSVFPGQSTLAVALSSLRVAAALLGRLGIEAPALAS
jgi:phytoene dehydrogenase-like protein